MIRSSPAPARCCALRLSQQTPAERFETAGRAQLQDVRQVVAREHGGAARAKFVQREQVAGRPRHHESDLFPSEPGSGAGRRQQRTSSSTPADEGSFPPVTKLPAAHLSRDQSLFFQHGVRGRNGGPVQSKQASQFASGW